MRRPSARPVAVLLATGLSSVPLAAAGASTRTTSAAHVSHASVTPNVQVSTCPGGNAEDEEALFGANAYVDWIGCDGIGFARSTDAGRTYGPSVTLPGSQDTACGQHGCANNSWDPAIAVSSSGDVYASFMHRAGTVSAPVVDVSFDGGQTFSRSVTLPVPPTSDPNGNWGDRDFIAVAPDGEVYVTWDYGPSSSELRIICSPIGSCSFTAGDLNAVLQTSTDGGQTWSALAPISPHFPLGGADIAPIVVQPNGAVDVLFQAFPTNATTDALRPGNEYVTRSTDGGATWSTPIKLGRAVGTVSLTEWWIDGAIATDPAGHLYATWDTQSAKHDIGWLSYSTDAGARWSAPVRVTSPTLDTEQLVEPVGVGRGLVDVAWQSPTPSGPHPGPAGYETFVRTFSIRHGWLQRSPIHVSSGFGNPTVWPGDTFGIATVPGGHSGAHGVPILLTWGGAVPASSRTSEIWASTVAP